MGSDGCEMKEFEKEVRSKEGKEGRKRSEQTCLAEGSRGARATSWIGYHLTGPAGSLPTPQHRKTPQYGGQLLLPA